MIWLSVILLIKSSKPITGSVMLVLKFRPNKKVIHQESSLLEFAPSITNPCTSICGSSYVIRVSISIIDFPPAILFFPLFDGKDVTCSWTWQRGPVVMTSVEAKHFVPWYRTPVGQGIQQTILWYQILTSHGSTLGFDCTI